MKENRRDAGEARREPRFPVDRERSREGGPPRKAAGPAPRFDTESRELKGDTLRLDRGRPRRRSGMLANPIVQEWVGEALPPEEPEEGAEYGADESGPADGAKQVDAGRAHERGDEQGR